MATTMTTMATTTMMSGDRRPATGDRRQATGDRRQATGVRRQATSDRHVKSTAGEVDSEGKMQKDRARERGRGRDDARSVDRGGVRGREGAEEEGAAWPLCAPIGPAPCALLQPSALGVRPCAQGLADRPGPRSRSRG